MHSLLSSTARNRWCLREKSQKSSLQTPTRGFIWTSQIPKERRLTGPLKSILQTHLSGEGGEPTCCRQVLPSRSKVFKPKTVNRWQTAATSFCRMVKLYSLGPREPGRRTILDNCGPHCGTEPIGVIKRTAFSASCDWTY